MFCSQGVMILIFKLDKRPSELSQVFIYQICQFVAGQDCLFLKNADITPRINDSRLDIPQSSITKEIRVIMKESCRTDHLTIASSLNIYHLSRLRAQEHDKAILLLTLLCCKREACRKGKHANQYDLKEPHQDYSFSRNLSAQPSRSKTQSLKRGSMTIYVVLILELIKSSIASFDLAAEASSRSRV